MSGRLWNTTPSGLAASLDWLPMCEPVGTFLDSRELTARFSAGFPHVSTERRHALSEIATDDTLTLRDRTIKVLADWLGYRSGGTDLLCDDSATLVSADNSVFVRTANETIAADLAIVEPAGKTHAGTVRIPIFITDSPHGDGRPTGSTWSATWSERAAILLKHLRSHNPACSVALVTDGVIWTLVHREESGAVTFGHFDVEIMTDPVESGYRAAFAKLLSPASLFGEREGNTLEDLFAASAKTQVEVSNSLGTQVRQACEQLVAALNRAQHEELAPGLRAVSDTELYQAVVTVFMRVVFTAFAEERRLLPVDDYPLYEQQYSLGALLRDLDDVALRFGDDALAQRATAWPRLLALFRLIYGGTSHPDLRLCGYGGDLFNPDRFPFLEGRTGEHSWREELAAPPRIDDRVTRSLLRSLLYLGSSRVHFRSLEIEQIGHVYERLLDHGVRTATEVMVGLVGRAGDEEEVALSALEALLKKSEREQVAELKELTGKTEKVLWKLRSTEQPAERLHLLRRAARGDEALFERLSKVLWLIREEYAGPVVLHPGERFLTRTSLRRETGTEYTPPALADEIAEWGLEPLVYDGPADGKPEAEWRLRTPKEILALRVCDPAVGSGAIIAAACRYLAGKLVDSWERYGYPEARDGNPRLRAMRLVAGACCYGVDMDPMALEMAKLSMWLLTSERDIPFTFLDHHFAAGNSLIGVHDLDQLYHAHIHGEAGVVAQNGQQSFNNLWLATAQQKVRDAAEWFAMIADIKPLDVADVEQQAQLYREAREEVRPLEHLADAVVGVAFASGDKKSKLKAGYQQLVTEVSVNWQHGVSDTPFTAGAALRHTHGVSPLHWALVFPDVFVDGGKFDVLVGNPPFVGGQKLRESVGAASRDYFVNILAGGRKGSADLAAYFLLRASTVADGFSFITTNTICQGDTRAVGLEHLVSSGWGIHQACRTAPWPGAAAVAISKLAARAGWAAPGRLGEWSGAISSLLERQRAVTTPTRLAENVGKAFQGSIVLGLGFTLDPNKEPDAAIISAEATRTPAVVFPYLNGEDLNSHPEQLASRHVINFRHWDEAHCKSTYPDAYTKVLRDVKPERTSHPAEGWRKGPVERWWQFAADRQELRVAISGKERVLALTIVSRLLLPAFVPAGQVFAHRLVVFAYDDDFHFGVLSSAFHQLWAARFSSTLGDAPNYAPSDCFLTFPQPPESEAVAAAAKRLNDHRSTLLKARTLTTGKKQEPVGLTGLYTMVHDPACTDTDVKKLRDLHKELDEAVAKAYGWDLDLRHGHYETDRLGMRWTIHPDAWDTALDLLLELNQQRAATQDAPPPDDDEDMSEDPE